MAENRAVWPRPGPGFLRRHRELAKSKAATHIHSAVSYGDTAVVCLVHSPSRVLPMGPDLKNKRIRAKLIICMTALTQLR